MKKLFNAKSIVAVALLASTVSANATMIRTFLIDAQIEGIMVCQMSAQYALTENPNLSFEKLTNELILPVRHKPNSEGDFIKAGSAEDSALDNVDHAAWHYGRDLVNQQGIKNKKQLDDLCIYGALSNVKQMAIKMGAKDFIDQNPQVFDGIE